MATKIYTAKWKDEGINPTENFDKVSGTYTVPKWTGGTGVAAQTDPLAQKYIDMNYTDWSKGDDYKSLTERYSSQGRRAMDDTMARVAARTGGLASSFAVTAGQQAYGSWMEKLEDAARSLYDSQKGEARDHYNVAQGIYDRQWDEFVNERDFEYGVHRDSVEDAKWKDTTLTGQYNTDREFYTDLDKYNTEQMKEDSEGLLNEVYTELYFKTPEELAAVTWDDYREEFEALGLTERDFNNIKNQASRDISEESKPASEDVKSAQEQIHVILQDNPNAEIPQSLIDASGWDAVTIGAYRNMYSQAGGETTAPMSYKDYIAHIDNIENYFSEDIDGAISYLSPFVDEDTLVDILMSCFDEEQVFYSLGVDDEETKKAMRAAYTGVPNGGGKVEVSRFD